MNKWNICGKTGSYKLINKERMKQRGEENDKSVLDVGQEVMRWMGVE